MNRLIKFRIWETRIDYEKLGKIYPSPEYNGCHKEYFKLYDIYNKNLEKFEKECLVSKMIYPKNFACMGNQFGWSSYGHLDCGSISESTNLDLEKTKNNYILMQFTGLYDKNGKEIYEGDIINRSYRHQGEYFTKKSIIVFEHGSFYIKDGALLFNYSSDDLEVIGNIFENKELLS